MKTETKLTVCGASASVRIHIQEPPLSVPGPLSTRYLEAISA